LEAQDAGRATRVLGHELALAGFVALLIDYEGTGDSSGPAEGGSEVGPWQGSVRAAVGLLRVAGAPHITIAGMRLGALLGASVAQACRADALVLWDPCETGRRYLREQALLRSAYMEARGLVDAPSAGGDQAGNTEMLGLACDSATASAISQLALTEFEGALDRRVLALLRPGQAGRPFGQRLAQANADVADAVGQEGLLGLKDTKGPVPRATISSIVGWVSAVAPPGTQAVELPACSTATVAGAPRPPGGGAGSSGGGAVSEEIVSLGPNGLFGIVARPAGPSSGATVVMVNSGDHDHVGPSRLWVRLSRQLALAGVQAVRADLGGLGDSAPRPGRAPDVAYPPHALDDVADIVRAVSPDTSVGAVLVGLCSGGYHCIRAGTRLGTAAGVRCVALINPSFAGPEGDAATDNGAGVAAPPEPRPEPGTPAGRSATPPGASVPPAESRKRWVQHLPARRLLRAVAAHLPDRAWWLVNRVGMETVPAKLLGQLVGGGVRTLVVLNAPEVEVIERGEKATLRRLQKGGLLRLEVPLSPDHALLLETNRLRALASLEEFLVPTGAP
jgi:hypothetical protein